MKQVMGIEAPPLSLFFFITINGQSRRRCEGRERRATSGSDDDFPLSFPLLPFRA